MGDKEIAHEMILAQERASRNADNEMGEFWKGRARELEESLSPAARLLLLIGGKLTDIGKW